MITCDKKSNIGYDFDVDLIINDFDNYYEAKKIKNIKINTETGKVYKDEEEITLTKLEYKILVNLSELYCSSIYSI